MGHVLEGTPFMLILCAHGCSDKVDAIQQKSAALRRGVCIAAVKDRVSRPVSSKSQAGS
jgi:hypothetical protein